MLVVVEDVVLEVDELLVDLVVAVVDDVLEVLALEVHLPGWSLRMVPPNSAHQRCKPLVRTTATLRCAGSSSVIPMRWVRAAVSRARCRER